MSKTFARNAVVARNAANDAGIGAILGLLLVTGLISANFEFRQLLVEGREPFSSLVAIITVVVAQCAMVSAFCGVFVRKFSDAENR